MCLGRVRALLIRPNIVADGLLAFLLVNGLFENMIFSILAGMPTIVWIIALCVPGLDVRDGEESDAIVGDTVWDESVIVSRESR